MDRASEEVLMAWYVYIAWLFAGAFLANAIPHTVQGICGNRFQTPFASPRGVGESSAVINVIWGLANFAIGAALLHIFFPSELRPPWSLCIAALIGALAMALYLANHFGKVRNSAPHP
jgi:MFS family permease